MASLKIDISSFALNDVLLLYFNLILLTYSKRGTSAMGLKFAESRFENYEILFPLILDICSFCTSTWPSTLVILPKSF